MGINKNSVIKNALSMALGTFSSRILGLIRESLLTSYFSREITDAWTVAFRLPNIFRRLLGEGSLSVSFIPVFVDCLHGQNDEVKARNLMNSLYTILLLVLAFLTVVGIVFSDVVLRWLLDDSYIQNVEKFNITNKMAQIMFGFIFLMSSYAYFMGILNALGKFTLAAMAPMLFNISMIVSTLIPNQWFSFSGEGLAWGVLVGGVLQTGLLIPELLSKGYFPKLDFNFKNPEMLKVLQNMIPGLFGMGLLQISLIINQRFASSLGEGVITYIYLADRLLEIPLALVSVSLGTALLPTLSKYFSEGNKTLMLDTNEYYLRLNLYIVIPAAVGLYFLSEPIVTVLFKRGHFQDHDVQMTAMVVQIWAMIMIPTSCVRVIAPAYYAVKNTWFPAVVSLVCLILHFILAPILMKQWGLRGLNYSSLVSGSVNFFSLFLLYFYFIGSLPIKKLVLSVIKVIFICSFMALSLSIFPWVQSLKSIQSIFWNNLLSLVVTMIVGISVFLILSYIFKMQEFQNTFQKVFEKIGKKMGIF